MERSVLELEKDLLELLNIFNNSSSLALLARAPKLASVRKANEPTLKA